MGVYDSASKLASEIKLSDEYKAFKKSMKEVKSDKNSENILKEYRLSQVELQNNTSQNKALDKRLAKKIETIENKIKKNKKVYNYLKNEQNLINMMNNINKILYDAVDKDYK